MPTDIIATQKKRAAQLQDKKTKAIATATQQQEEDDKDGGSKKKMVRLHVEKIVHGRLVKTWIQDKLMDEAALNPTPTRTEVVGGDNASKVMPSKMHCQISFLLLAEEVCHFMAALQRSS